MNIKAFRSRWANPIEPIENGPLIPACNYTDGSYLPKQCDPSTYEPENFPDFFLEDGRVIEANRQEIKFTVENLPNPNPDRPLLNIKDFRIHLLVRSEIRTPGILGSDERSLDPFQRVECYCVEETGIEIDNTRTGPFERARLNCNHAKWITHYIKWREHHFGKWIHTFKDYLKAKNYQNEKTARSKYFRGPSTFI